LTIPPEYRTAYLVSNVIALALLRPPDAPPYSATAAFVSRSARAGDVVVASDADYLPLRLDADRGRLRAPLTGIPRL